MNTHREIKLILMQLFNLNFWKTSHQNLLVYGDELHRVLRLEYLTYSILCDSFAQEILGNRNNKCRVLERFYHAELERKQLTKWKCWNINCFHEYLTHTAGTSRLSSSYCKDPHRIIILAKFSDSVFHCSSITASALYYMKVSCCL